MSKGSEHAPQTKDVKSGGGRRGGFLLSKYRSGIKRAILIELTKNPGASDLEVCRGLDADGSIDVPRTLQAEKKDRPFVAAYSNRLSSRRRVEVAISRVRTDLRKRGCWLLADLPSGHLHSPFTLHTRATFGGSAFDHANTL